MIASTSVTPGKIGARCRLAELPHDAFHFICRKFVDKPVHHRRLHDDLRAFVMDGVRQAAMPGYELIVVELRLSTDGRIVLGN